MSSGENGESLGKRIWEILGPQNLRYLFREIQGTMTNLQFAEVLGVSESFVFRIANGQREVGGQVLRALFVMYPEREADLLAAIRCDD